MIVSVQQGNLQVIQTGSVLISNNEPTTFRIDGDYRIIINYKDSKENSTQDMAANPIENGISIDLINFNNPLGTSTTSPIPIAKQNNRTIYIALTVHAIGEAKVLTYGIYVGSEVCK